MRSRQRLRADGDLILIVLVAEGEGSEAGDGRQAKQKRDEGDTRSHRGSRNRRGDRRRSLRHRRHGRCVHHRKHAARCGTLRGCGRGRSAKRLARALRGKCAQRGPGAVVRGGSRPRGGRSRRGGEKGCAAESAYQLGATSDHACVPLINAGPLAKTSGQVTGGPTQREQAGCRPAEKNSAPPLPQESAIFKPASSGYAARVIARRILFVANSSWNLAHFRKPLLRAFKADGWIVEAAVPTGQGPVSGADRTHAFPLKPEGTAPFQELKSLLALIRLFHGLKPDVVAGFTPKGAIYSGLAARATGTATLPNVSGLGTGFIRGGLLQRLQATLYREAFRDVPVVFFQNRDDSLLFTKLGLVDPQQVRILPGSGVDCRRFSPSPLPSSAIGEGRLLFVGRLLGDKGVRELAEAMRMLKPRYPRLSLTMVGALGAANRTAVTKAELAGWEDEGLLQHAGETDDVRPFLQKADAVVLPSYREGMPRALLEGAATGRPLLAANVPGCRELVRDGENGLLFEARSADSLAEAIERFLLMPPGERQRLGATARRLAERDYDEAIVVDAYREAVIALSAKAR